MKIFTYPSRAAEKRIAAIENRALVFKQKDIANVQKILNAVQKKGDRALIEYVNRFDSPGLEIAALKVTPREMASAAKTVDSRFRRTLNRAATQIETFHTQQVRKSWIDTRRSGTMVGQWVQPVDSAGVYVPGGTGGKTPLVSSVLMGAIPAKIAGVGRIVMATPPQKDGSIDPHLLVTAKKVGISEIYKIGSAWAIAALAYGTPTVPKVDVIVGPGNIYVTLAKKLVSGTVGIDLIAGPSEILVIADHSARPDFIAADLLSQAEHDAMASAVLVTLTAEMATAVSREIDTQIQHLPRKEIARKSLDRYGAILRVPDLEAALEVANRIAPEHLELQIEAPFDHVWKIRHAGAVFIGNYTPEPVGDYVAGPNHVLPTAGTARFASALSVDHFVRKTSLIRYSKEAFRREAADIIRLAEIEGLDAHANAVSRRLAPG